MPRIVWPLLGNRPIIEILLTRAADGQTIRRRLLADTGAGTAMSAFELLVEESDCLLCGGSPMQPLGLQGAYQGPFPSYLLRVRIPVLGFDHSIRVVAIPPLSGLDGIAGFRFLNRFTYGNFGNPSQFGLETP
jgi:hypothetical protein